MMAKRKAEVRLNARTDKWMNKQMDVYLADAAKYCSIHDARMLLQQVVHQAWTMMAGMRFQGPGYKICEQL